MSERNIRCERCGARMRIGQFPFCPHGVTHVATHGDDIPGGQVIETLGHDEMTFYSKKAILKAADTRGLRLRDCWAGPSDQHLTNWAAAVSAKTLADAKVLLERSACTKTTEMMETVRCHTASMTVREIITR